MDGDRGPVFGTVQVKGENMAVHAYFTAAVILLGVSVGGTMDISSPSEEMLLIATHEALAGTDKISVTLATQETPQVEKLVDIRKLRAQVVAKLKEAGIEYMEDEAGVYPRLIVQIEGVAVPECARYVCRVQTSMNRVVTFTAVRDLQVEAEVWRLRPVMKVATGSEAGKVIADAVLAQVEAFIDACQSARKLQTRLTSSEPNTPASGAPSRAKSSSQDPQTASQLPFVASKSASVFHRPDCRWAQNISGDNRLSYKTREEAVQASKRPCKSCKP
jgi:hypothetical protein